MNILNTNSSYIKGFRPPHTPIFLFLLTLTGIIELNRKRKN